MSKSRGIKKVILKLPKEVEKRNHDDSKNSISPSFGKEKVENLYDFECPFKSEKYVTPKRYRTAKQIITQEKAQITGVFTGKSKYDKNSQSNRINLKNPPVYYWQLDNSPSILPSKKYCDITGLQAPYLDPKTNLRYSSSEVYQVIKNLPLEVPQEYLSVRNAAVILR
ncbi:hypothetical protein K502DRAFT_308982 [Neoconidiobolus thromboides FSU 785]|nr:hypothetical protein K502DRAFT_308982 [Neoconidiobolus thromboides FSU 785]